MGFTDIKTYILTGGRNFKIFLKENYTVILGSCYLFTKRMLNMELNMNFIVLWSLHIYISLSWTLQQICWMPCNLSRWWIWQSVVVCNIIRFSFICFYGGGNFLRSLDGSRTLARNEIMWSVGFKWDRQLWKHLD